MSAAKAACDHIRSLWHGTHAGEWVSMGVFSDGKHYNAPEGVMFSFPGKQEDYKPDLVATGGLVV